VLKANCEMVRATRVSGKACPVAGATKQAVWHAGDVRVWVKKRVVQLGERRVNAVQVAGAVIIDLLGIEVVS
jgi:hypothetical protein